MPSAPELFRNVTDAAIVLASGGKYVTQSVVNGMLVFHIIPPEGFDLEDPDRLVGAQALRAYADTLASRVRAHRRQREAGR